MNSHSHDFQAGDRVRAKRRRDFPNGTIVQALDSGFLIVRWDGDRLETIDHADLERLPPSDA